MMTTVLKGNIVSATALGKLEITENGYMVLEDGVITGIHDRLPEAYAHAPLEDYGDCLILQSFADMHFHAPQYAMQGMGFDLPLLEWLEKYAFPTEARYLDIGFAREVYSRLAREMVQNGTTRMCVFSTLHRPATLVLMEELEKAGAVAYVGKVNMDRNSPDFLRETTEGAKTETLRWLDECSRFRNVKPMITPRFTPSCTDELMTFLGKLVQERNLPVQSHLSENRAEMNWVRRLHPDCQQYWETYAKFGLWTDRTLMAHCVWCDERERKAIREAGVTMVHCGASNNNILSGTAPVRQMLDEGIKVVLGNDVGAGDSLQGFDLVADSVRASKTKHVQDGWTTPFLTVAEGWYLGTTAGAEFFGAGKGFAVGDALHAIVLDDSRLLTPRDLTVQERFERSIYRRQNDAIRAVWSEGRKVVG
ncbi:MAG: guanine deaminase [Ruminococcaceae bacterium]|nr:guanine deaminase [Oscillospiraceae bacterium]